MVPPGLKFWSICGELASLPPFSVQSAFSGTVIHHAMLLRSIKSSYSSTCCQTLFTSLTQLLSKNDYKSVVATWPCMHGSVTFEADSTDMEDCES